MEGRDVHTYGRWRRKKVEEAGAARRGFEQLDRHTGWREFDRHAQSSSHLKPLDGGSATSWIQTAKSEEEDGDRTRKCLDDNR